MNSSRSLRGTQLTLQFPKILWSICCASCVALAGCAGIGQSLHVNSITLRLNVRKGHLVISRLRTYRKAVSGLKKPVTIILMGRAAS
jgi:hypothetical protein